jgi:hypothetical protein
VISAVALVSILTLPMPAAAEDLASSIVGVWKYTSVIVREVESGKDTRPYGEKPSGYIVYTRGGRIVFALVGDNRKLAGPIPTDAERMELFKTSGCGSGIYKVEGNTVSVTYDVHCAQIWTGTIHKRQAEIAGNKLTITSAPVKDARTGLDIVYINTYERVE